MRSQKGFTLVEILIVVVILGILAAIVIPQFTSASTEAKNNSLKADLQTLRSQIELFKIQHDDTWPGGGMGSLTDVQFVTDMTTRQTYGGKAYGPYMQKVPANAFTNSGTMTFVATGSHENNAAGWNMDPNTGEVHPTDTVHYDDPNY